MNMMLAQIQSLPRLLRESVQPMDDMLRATLDQAACRPLKRVYVVGCGDSHHAALGSELAIEALAGLPVEPMTGLQFSRYAVSFLPENGAGANLVIGISVSGEVARTIEALTLAGQAGASTLALTATPGSRAAMAAGRALQVTTPPFPDPPGTHTPGVLTYAANQLALFLVAVRLGEARGVLTRDAAAAARRDLGRLADAAERTITDCQGAARELAEEWGDSKEFVFVGGGPNYASALFSAAKMLEASGDAAIAQETEEWAHMQYFALAAGTPTFFISAGARDLSRAVEVAVAARTIGRRVAAVAPPHASALSAAAHRTLPLADGIREMFSPLVAIIPGALFAAHRADLSGEPFFRAFGGGRNLEDAGGISRIRTSKLVKDLVELKQTAALGEHRSSRDA